MCCPYFLEYTLGGFCFIIHHLKNWGVAVWYNTIWYICCRQRSNVTASRATWLHLMIPPGRMGGCAGVIWSRMVAVCVCGEMTNLLGLWHYCLILWNEWMNVLGMPRLLSDVTALLTALCRWATARVLPFDSQHSGVEKVVSEFWFCFGSDSWCDTQPSIWAM